MICSNNLDIKEDTQRIFYYDDEDDYEEDDYDYDEDYSKDTLDDTTIFKSSDPTNYLQFPLVTPRKTTKTTTITTTTTTTTMSTTTEKATEATRRSTSGRKSYSPGGYKRYDSSKDTAKQRPRSYEAEVTTTAPKAKDIACNSPQMLKKFLKSGAHGNDPRKIAAMIAKCKKDKENAPQSSDNAGSNQPEEDSHAKSIFEKYASKKSIDDNEVDLPPKSFLPPGYNGFEPSKTSSKGKYSNRKIGSNYGKTTASPEDEDYDDEDYDDEEYDDEETNDDFKPYGGVARPKGTSSSSNLFRKFIKDNAGKTVRRPTNIDNEEGKVASDIFKKYSSGFKTRAKGSYNKVSNVLSIDSRTNLLLYFNSDLNS